MDFKPLELMDQKIRRPGFPVWFCFIKGVTPKSDRDVKAWAYLELKRLGYNDCGIPQFIGGDKPNSDLYEELDFA